MVSNKHTNIFRLRQNNITKFVYNFFVSFQNSTSIENHQHRAESHENNYDTPLAAVIFKFMA